MTVVELAEKMTKGLREMERDMHEADLIYDLQRKRYLAARERVRALLDMVDPINSRVKQNAQSLEQGIVQ